VAPDRRLSTRRYGDGEPRVVCRSGRGGFPVLVDAGDEVIDAAPEATIELAGGRPPLTLLRPTAAGRRYPGRR
jgi:hypothetical protein